MTRHATIHLLIVLYAAYLPASALAGDSRLEFFESRVRPVLVQRCEKCHGPKKQQGGLRLDQKSGWARGGDQGPAIVPGKPDASLIIKAVRYHDDDLKMPPGGNLSEREIAALVEWVQQGALDPRDGGPSKLGGMSLADAKSFWSFQPVKSPAIPASRSRSTSPIDAFLEAGLDRAQLTPLPPADKRTLIRRATYDLTGLPPTPEEVAAFLRDQTPGAFAHLVDRLLASPRYGERWGRHWLDLARYADSAGENTDHPLPHAWKYRNWVIAAFNHDMPYDEFVQAQIAGDLIAREGPPAAYADRVVATGFLAIARRFGHDIDKDMYLTHEDVIDTVGKVFLGLSIGCARCHAHKYDPISAEDYYALYGIFESTRFSFPGCEPNPMPRDLVSLQPEGVWEETVKPYRDRLAALEQQLLPIKAERAALAKGLTGRSLGSPRVLAQGAIDDGGSQLVATADGKTSVLIEVKPGQMVQLVVLPRGSHGADSTKVEWEIVEQGGPRQHWNLTRDALQAGLADNPLKDATGRGGAWYFVDGRRGGRLLEESIRVLDGQAGLHAWKNGDTPSVFLNATGRPIEVWTPLPAYSFFVHPAPDGPVEPTRGGGRHDRPDRRRPPRRHRWGRLATGICGRRRRQSPAERGRAHRTAASHRPRAREPARAPAEARKSLRGRGRDTARCAFAPSWRPGKARPRRASAVARNTGRPGGFLRRRQRAPAARRLALRQHQPAGGPRDGQPDLATPLRPGTGHHTQRLRHARAAPRPSRFARLAGRPAC
jgi:hypothetical protein